MFCIYTILFLAPLGLTSTRKCAHKEGEHVGRRTSQCLGSHLQPGAGQRNIAFLPCLSLSELWFLTSSQANGLVAHGAPPAGSTGHPGLRCLAAEVTSSPCLAAPWMKGERRLECVCQGRRALLGSGCESGVNAVGDRPPTVETPPAWPPRGPG